MSLKDQRELDIRRTHKLIRDYEAIVETTADPKERRRAERVIAEQQEILNAYLTEYGLICRRLDLPISEDIVQIAIAIGVMLSSVAETEASPASATTPSATSTQPMGSLSKAYALLIGVGAYRHMRPLAKTTTDADDLHDLLVQSGYLAANLALLLDEQATKAAINDKLDWLARRAGTDDTVVIFFSGHGTQRIGGFAPGEYVCPVEADWYNLQATAISDEELTIALRAIPARRVIVFLDACHSGGVGEPKDAGVMVEAGLSEAAYKRLTEGEGRVVIASCKPDEISWELPGMRNGLFTHYLLEGLRGAAAGPDGAVRIFDVFNYVSQKVPQHKPQHPLFKGEIDLNFTIALMLQAEAIQQAASTSVPLPVGLVAPSMGLIVNPGFEEGFVGWSEDQAQLEHGGQSVEDSTETHRGQQSRKLFLRWGGSKIIQGISLPTPLPTGIRITLRAWVKMPHAGSQSNKWFTLELVTISADGRKESKAIDQSDALPDWSQLSVGPLVTGFPVTRLEIHAMTSKGNGSYRGFDQPVWVDDFELDIQ